MKTSRHNKQRFGGSWAIVVAVIAAVVGAIFTGCSDGVVTTTSSGEGGCTFDCSGSNSSSGSSSSSSGMGGGGGGGAWLCTGDADCGGFQDCQQFIGNCDCIDVGCVQGYCVPSNLVPVGMPAKSQTNGNCRKKVCDGQGFAMNLPDPTNVAPDGDDCTDDVCSMGLPAHPPSAEGTPCPMGLCNGQGLCIQCVDTTQCLNGTICLSSICVPPTCTNGMQDAGESDVDCGSSCIRCALGQKCLMNDDCKSSNCFEGLCK